MRKQQTLAIQFADKESVMNLYYAFSCYVYRMLCMKDSHALVALLSGERTSPIVADRKLFQRPEPRKRIVPMAAR